MNATETGEALMAEVVRPVMPESDGRPFFYYASLSSLWVYYQVDPARLDSILSSCAPGFSTYRLANGMGLVNINFFSFASHSGRNNPDAYADILKSVDPASTTTPAMFGVEPTNECEFNIAVYPTARAGQTPRGMTLGGLIAGKDHTKTIGTYRIYVTSDDRIAVYWGTRNFGENKVLTHPYIYNVPSPNNPGQIGWSFTVPGTVDEPFDYHPRPPDPKPPETCDPFMYSLDFDASNVPPSLCNPSEIVHYSLITEEGTRRPVGSRRNVFGAMLSYDFAKVSPKAAALRYGTSKHPLVTIMRELLGETPAPAAAQTFQSQPAVAESSLFYVDL
jgi:hypothetical protein